MTTDQARIAKLVQGAQSGDTMAVHDLLDLLEPYAGRLCGPIALADGQDATQEALIAIFRGIPRLRHPRVLFGWARTVAVREAVRVARRSAGSGPADLTEVPAPGDPYPGADIRDVLDRLSPEQRAVLVLRDMEGLDERSMGRLLKISSGTVKSRLHRVRPGLRKARGR